MVLVSRLAVLPSAVVMDTQSVMLAKGPSGLPVGLGQWKALQLFYRTMLYREYWRGTVILKSFALVNSLGHGVVAGMSKWF